MKEYERPEILATYTVAELVEESAVCVQYGGTSPTTTPCDPVTDPNCGN
jgi:hypothetical protein